MARGGAREGAGRPGDGRTCIPVQVRPETAEWLAVEKLRRMAQGQKVSLGRVAGDALDEMIAAAQVWPVDERTPPKRRVQVNIYVLPATALELYKRRLDPRVGSQSRAAADLLDGLALAKIAEHRHPSQGTPSEALKTAP
jgi:hypothetical protein